MRILFFILSFFLLPLSGIDAHTVVEDASDLKVLTPTLAERQTCKIRLENGLEAYLISDPGTHQSGAALTIEVGSWDDPGDRPGMAHFVEHLLFLGTEKYPDEDEYELYLDTYGGNRNAFTMDDRTGYMFSVDNPGFEGALDRFAQFFIAPLFNPSGVERESIAIDQEFAKDVPIDAWRVLHVHKELANPHHPFHRFGIGNKHTLLKISQEELKEWYQGHYSANLMHLVVYSALPMEELINEVSTHFSQVKNRHNKPVVFDEPLLSKKTAGKLLTVTPFQNLQSLDLVWELPPALSANRKVRADDLLSYVLGHEGKESLITQLKKEELAEDLRVGTFRGGRDQNLFTLSVKLTAKGIKNYGTVIERCFEALASIRSQGIPKYIFDEITHMETVNYAYQQREEVFEYVTDCARLLVDEPLTSFPKCSLMPTEYQPEAIVKLLDHLTPSTCHFTLLASPELSHFKPNKKERWMGVPYGLFDIPQKKLLTWSRLAPHGEIACPSPNEFLPKNLSLVAEEKPSSLSLIANTLAGKLYHAGDVEFRVPEVSWTFTLRTPYVKDALPKSHVLADLYCHAVSEQLNALSYSADLGGLTYALSPTHNGLKLKINGYSEKAAPFLTSILENMKEIHPTVEEFLLYKDLASRNYLNTLNKSPVSQGIDLLKGILYKDHPGLADKQLALSSLAYEDFVHFCQDVLSATYTEGIFYGNLTDQEAHSVWERVQKEIASAPFPPESHPLVEIAHLPAGKNPPFLVRKTTLPGNLLILTIDCGNFTFKKRAAQEILAKGLETPFFSELRTRQQTGYLVANWGQEIERHLYSCFLVQSNSHDTRDLLSRFELFIESSLQNLNSTIIPKERFESIRNALIAQLENPAEKMSKKGELYHTLAFEYDSDFEWLEKRIQGLKELSYEEFEESALAFLGKENRRRVAIAINGTLPPHGQLNYRRLTSPKKLRHEITYSKG